VRVRGDRKGSFRVNVGGESKGRLTTVAEFFVRSWNPHRIQILCLEIRTNTNGTRSAGDSWSRQDSSIPVTTQAFCIERMLLYMMR
jgi:hypothetical protein